MATAATNVAEKYVELSHGKTRYLEAGSGPPVILLHGVGYTGGGDQWIMNMGPLSERFRVLAPDFLGWGLGDRLDIEYSFAYLVDFVREFQDALGIEKSHIVGHSMGGWVASVFAYESPERVDKLVLVAAGGTRTRTISQMTEFKPPSSEEIRKQVETTFIGDNVDYAKLAEINERKTNVPGGLESYRKILGHMNNPANRSRYNTRRRLEKVKAPTLIVWGRDDQTNAVEMAEDTNQLVKGSKLVIIENCGHMVPQQCADPFNRALLEFL